MKKIIFFISLILLIFMCIVFFSFDKLERELYVQNCNIIKNLIDYELNKQMSATIDWAKWDDTVNFLNNKNDNYIKSNIDIDTLKNIGIDFMIFFDKYRSPIYSYFVKNNGKITTFQQVFILKLSTKFYNYLSTPNNLKKVKTIEKIDKNLYLLTFYPILKNSGKPPAFGTLVFGKRFNKKFLTTIESITKSKISFLLNFNNSLNENGIVIKKTKAFIPIKNYSGETVAILLVSLKKHKIFVLVKWLILIFMFIIIGFVVIFFKIYKTHIQFNTKQELELLTKAIEQAKTGIILTEFDGTIFYVNNIVCKVTGYTKKELYGKKSTILLDEKLLLEIFNSSLKTKFSWKGEIKGKTKDGKEIDLEISIVPLLEDNGRIRCFITTCEFVSDRKKMILELEKAKKEADNFALFKSTILANLSHEFKTPLTGINGFIDLLETTNLNEEQKRYLKYLKESADKLMKFLTNFIKLVNLEANLYNIKNELFSLKKLNITIVEKFKPHANKKGLLFKYYYDEKIPDKLIGSEDILYRILSLVIDNAIKFT